MGFARSPKSREVCVSDEQMNDGQGGETTEGLTEPTLQDLPDEAARDERVGFWRRLGAYLLDTVFGGVLGVIVAGAAGGADRFDTISGDVGVLIEQALQGGSVWPVVVSLLYALIEGMTGASPGKMILAIQIRSADGSPAELSLLIPRFLLKGVLTVLGLVGIVTGVVQINYAGMVAGTVIFLGCFLVLGVSRQALHDRILGTAVYLKAD